VTRGGVLIFDAHEIYPEQLAEHMRSEIWYQFYSRLERYLMPYTDGRITVCDSLGTYFQKTYKSAPFLTLRNTPSIKHLPDQSILDRSNLPIRLLYHGAYFPYRGLDELIAIADKIEKGIFIFRGIGGYETALKAQAKAKHLDHRVCFEPPVSIDALVSSASLCDIGLNPFISVCLNTEYALPNKYFEYMMAGLAVASSDLIEMRLLTKKLDNGILFDPTNPEQMTDCINHLIQDHERLHAYRRHSYEAAKTEFHWENEEKKFRAYIHTLT
jgi:glycosyltransferase involved in cell wall biosynthesis